MTFKPSKQRLEVAADTMIERSQTVIVAAARCLLSVRIYSIPNTAEHSTSASTYENPSIHTSTKLFSYCLQVTSLKAQCAFVTITKSTTYKNYNHWK